MGKPTSPGHKPKLGLHRNIMDWDYLYIKQCEMMWRLHVHKGLCHILSRAIVMALSMIMTGNGMV